MIAVSKQFYKVDTVQKGPMKRPGFPFVICGI